MFLPPIERQNPAVEITNSDTLTFRVTFSETVVNVGVNDFSVNGTTTATVTGAANVDTNVFDITVSGGDLAN